MHIGASFVVLEKTTPDDILRCDRALPDHGLLHGAGRLSRHDRQARRPRHLLAPQMRLRRRDAPKPTFDAWLKATGIKLMDSIGATEMLHIFISATEDEIRPGATGKPVPGYEAKIVDDAGHDMPPGTMGRLAVRGPTGCRYLADERQRKYVQNGWNITGDTYLMDSDGYFWYQSRSDDMIVSAGYNIAGTDVEAALLTHPAVAECGVVGAPDEARGMIVKAYVIAAPGVTTGRSARGRIAGVCQTRDRALQISARDRVRDATAEDRDRQVEALCPAATGAGRGDVLGRRGGMKKKDRELSVTTPKGPQLAVLPTAAEDGTRSRAQVLQPSGWPMPKGYANGMAAEGAHRRHRRGDRLGRRRASRGRLCRAGASDPAPTSPAILAEAGARPEHLVRLTWYVVDMDEYLAQPEGAGQGLPRHLRRALSRDGAGSGRPPRREGGARRDRGHRRPSSLSRARDQLALEARLGELVVLGRVQIDARTWCRPSTDGRAPSSRLPRSPPRRWPPAERVPR